MINALKNLPEQEAQNLLSVMIKEILPSPEVPTSPAWDEAQARVSDQALQEVRRRLKLAPDDHTEAAQAQILRLLSEEIGAYVSRPATFNRVKARLGDKGGLRPDQYDVKFSKSFDDSCPKRGIRRGDARDVVLHPDDVQHLTPPKGTFNERSGMEVSLYAKSLTEVGSLERHTLLVVGLRGGYTVNVTSAWLVYHSDVDMSSARSPLDILESFVQTYGVPFVVGKSAAKKFYRYEAIAALKGEKDVGIMSFPPTVGPTEGEMRLRVGPSGVIEVRAAAKGEKDVEIMSLPRTTGHTEAEMLLHMTPSGVFEVRAAFIIDVAKYIEDLRKHGVQATN